MKTFIGILLFFSYTSVFAQFSQKQLDELRENTAKIESTRVQLEASIKESQHRMDSINMENFNRQNTRNLNAFVAMQKEQQHKSMQRMYWRIGFGVLMLVVLVVGWRRKKK